MQYNPENYANDLNKEVLHFCLIFQIFDLFDLDRSGRLDIKDLEEIGRAMGWKREEG